MFLFQLIIYYNLSLSYQEIRLYFSSPNLLSNFTYPTLSLCSTNKKLSSFHLLNQMLIFYILLFQFPKINKLKTKTSPTVTATGPAPPIRADATTTATYQHLVIFKSMTRYMYREIVLSFFINQYLFIESTNQ